MGSQEVYPKTRKAVTKGNPGLTAEQVSDAPEEHIAIPPEEHVPVTAHRYLLLRFASGTLRESSIPATSEASFWPAVSEKSKCSWARLFQLERK